MARRCLETVTVDGQAHTCVVLTSDGLASLQQANSTIKPMGYPILNNLISTFGNVWIDSRYLYETPAFSHSINGSGKLFDVLEGEMTDNERSSYIKLENTKLYSNTISKNYPYNGFYWGFVVDDDTKESWILGGVVAITASGNSALGAAYYSSPALYCALMNMAFDASNGGGATHIAKRAGLLSSIGASNLSDILMVSGGGGGGLLVGDTDYSGKEAGGISGSGDNSADQSTGYAFGQGESGTNVSGGGSGLYGGYKGTSSKSGGAGSGYIGNTFVSNKKMVGYNVPTSSAESTKTESVNEASESPVSGKPKIGNGHVRIKFLREIQE